MSLLASTFSIAGRDRDRQLGVAVSSRVPAVGGRCVFIRPGLAAISSQAYLNPYLALEILDSLSNGSTLEAATQSALKADLGHEWRQLVAVDLSAAPFAFTGSETDPWAGHRTGPHCAAAGNLLLGEETVSSMVDSFEQSEGTPLPERLLSALEAGQAAGGDRRGRQSAALVVYVSEAMSYVDLRVDDHADPVAELRRIWGLYSNEDRENALRMASTREPRPLEEIKQRQTSVRNALAEQGR
jgi:uncharacterized Ntn-hydrolase superfamily protein